jgi:hypothetical protein
MAQDRDQWRDLVNKVMNLLKPKEEFHEISDCQFHKKELGPWSYKS